MNSRLLKEWTQLNKNGNKYCLFPINENDMTHWQSVLAGPNNSPYRGHKFTLYLDVPSNYPMSPPKVRFKPYSMPHSNVDWKTGTVCLDILENMWSPIFNLQYVVESCLRLLTEPNGESPLNLELGILLRAGDYTGYNGLINYYLNHQRNDSISE